MDTILQLALNGLAVGCIYGLVALGFVLIYKATELVNFAQGDLLMLGAFTCYSPRGSEVLASSGAATAVALGVSSWTGSTRGSTTGVGSGAGFATARTRGCRVSRGR